VERDDRRPELTSRTIAAYGTGGERAGMMVYIPLLLTTTCRRDRATVLAAVLQSVTFRPVGVTWLGRAKFYSWPLLRVWKYLVFSPGGRYRIFTGNVTRGPQPPDITNNMEMNRY
jgi:hypothetical protein